MSRILRSLLKPIAWVCSVATAVCSYNAAVEAGALAAMSLPLAQINPSIITLTSFALSLLLVFRTNTSYGRFDEARKMWGATLNRSRDVARQVMSGFPDGYEQHKLAMCRWLVAYARSLRVHLQNEGNLQQDLKGVLSPPEMQLLLNAPHRPLAALMMMSEIVKNVRGLDPLMALQIGQNITHFQDQLGGCERLLRTPIPLSYTRHTERFLLIWLTLVPLGFWSMYNWMTIPVSALLAMLLLGIDEIGIEIEEPFGILPLSAVADVIQRDVMAQVRDWPGVTQVASILGLTTPSPSGESSLAPAPVKTNGSGNGNGTRNGNGNGNKQAEPVLHLQSAVAN